MGGCKVSKMKINMEVNYPPIYCPFTIHSIRIENRFVMDFINFDISNSSSIRILRIKKEYYINLIKNEITINERIKDIIKQIRSFINKAGCYILIGEDETGDKDGSWYNGEAKNKSYWRNLNTLHK
ncbi:unnamed protein product [marine sediment metagenome]|uniref:Uncharacterized protein n=1 Tax=marine sediment metagenome TaxID=412755 RepID=X1D7C7_9ZZZZ